MIIRVGRKDRPVPLGLAKNGAVRVIAEAALVIKISVRFNMHRNYSWTEHGNARFATASLSDQHVDAPQKNKWLARGSLITLLRGASRLLSGA
jgi:hypothetical protein